MSFHHEQQHTQCVVVSSVKVVSVASHLNLLFFCVLNLFLLGIQPPFTVSKFSVVSHLSADPPWSFKSKVDLQLSWLTTENFKNYEAVKGSVGSVSH